MAASIDTEPILRTTQDEEHDIAEQIKNINATAYHDWPNDAGFDGLSEERGPVELKLTGQIPAWAAGSLYRTGPGMWKIDDTSNGTVHISHWFDGLAQTHRFDISAGDNDSNVKVHYSSRHQSKALIARIQKDGYLKIFTFAQRQDPCLGIFSKAMSNWRASFGRAIEEENVAVTIYPNLPSSFTPAVEITDNSTPNKGAGATNAPAVSGQTGGHRGGMPNSIWLCTDSTAMKQIDPATLEPIGFARQSVLHPDLNGPSSCAHAQRDPVTGDVFNYNLGFGRLATYRIFRVSASTGKTEILATIARPSVKPAYIHSFYLTPSFVILCIPSSHFGLQGLKVQWNRNYVDSLVPFSPENKCQWFVVDRLHGGGVVAEFETEAGFFFHSVNAFEEEDAEDKKNGTVSVSCDTVEYPNYDVITSMYYDVLLQRNSAADEFWGSESRRRGAIAHLARYSFRAPRPQPSTADTQSSGPATSGIRLTATNVFCIPGPHCGELPTINPRFATRPYRFIYSLPNRGRSTLMDGIVKTDLQTHEALFWNNPHGHTPGEAIFVPRPDGQDEDDGVLLSVVLDGHARTSYLLCLDARTMREVGRAEVGRAVGLGFHGAHNPAGTGAV